ncbi:2-dehydropantoate 2-reductase [Mesobacterium sp. TK19101]|uniref:2-dehydropantoate 2-reductase n=1 Tax=Mesobacterium hydrothermale TaxID=3111907 RepID=A0ABU6HF64_9RHOB|nr:2-dehydropantoate 2-reductase [Mesobacterium sp. TK19101]MEC3861105.1 2-dehydropantoate 2-reductase [Mesobacterium sp. TK19101]
MKFAVMGAGALGGYFGARLAAAGHSVGFIARGTHLAALRDTGLRIVSPLGDLHLDRVTASDAPADIGPVDVVLLAVKNGDVADAAKAIAPMLRDDTMVVTVQNGITAPEILAETVGQHHVLPGVARIPGEISEPGVMMHNSDNNALNFGEWSGGTSARAEALLQAMTVPGMTPQRLDDIWADLWTKFIMQSAFSGVSAAGRLDIGQIRSTPATTELFWSAMREAEAVARAEAAQVPDDVLDRVWGFMTSMPATVRASMLDDLRKGKPIEVDFLSGEIARRGRALGIPTPVQSTLHGLLRPYAKGMA